MELYNYSTREVHLRLFARRQRLNQTGVCRYYVLALDLGLVAGCQLSTDRRGEGCSAWPCPTVEYIHSHESRTCLPAFMSIPSCPSPSTIRSPPGRRSPCQPRQARARPLPCISPGPPRAGRRAPRPSLRARVSWHKTWALGVIPLEDFDPGPTLEHVCLQKDTVPRTLHSSCWKGLDAVSSAMQ